MPSAQTIVRAFEYGRVALPAPWNTASVRARLEETSVRAGHRAFETRGRELYARGVVGVVDLGGLSVEILPKTRENCGAEEAAIFLSELLRFGGLVDRVSTREARTDAGERSMLELLLAWAARTTAHNLREGVPRRYQVRSETSVAVRGRIEIARLARRPPGRDYEVSVRYAPLSEDNAVSRIIRWLVREILARSRMASTRQICSKLLQETDFVADIRPEVSDLDRLSLQPTEAHWRPLLEFARLLLLQTAPNPGRAGAHDAVAVLFTLHDIFERVLRRVFREGLAGAGLVLRSSDLFLLRGLPPEERRFIKLKPDYLFSSPGQPARMVGDAKWKRILDISGRLALNEADAYQVSTYVSAFDVNAGLIVCPTSRAQPGGVPLQRSFDMAMPGKRLHILGVHLPTLISSEPAGKEARRRLCETVVNLAPAAEEIAA